MIVAVAAVAAAASGCSDAPAPERSGQPVDQKEGERRDLAVEQVLAEMQAAARRGDRATVAGQQRELERLARGAPKSTTTSSARDPFQRLLDDFEFKRAPLFAQQITSAPDRHRLYVGVDGPTYCLLAPDARRSVVEQVYEPADRTLRAAGVTDLEFVLVALTERAARLEQALAIGRDGALRLTQRGRAC
jgi:uncharacterized protein YjeT (DUF2065 family)